MNRDERAAVLADELLLEVIERIGGLMRKDTSNGVAVELRETMISAIVRHEIMSGLDDIVARNDLFRGRHRLIKKQLKRRTT